jgi:glycosyltransferase involved in cell wall biosynthesis
MVTSRAVVRFHAVSAPVADEMAARMHVRRDRIVVVPRARRRDRLGEPSEERRLAVRAANEISDDAVVVLAIARQEHVKGLDVLIDAVRILRHRGRELTVLVAGRPGRASDELRRQLDAVDLNASVRFLGARADVADLIVAADVVAVPSRAEGLPGAVVEAMALECPVVASDLPMVREAIGDHAVRLVAVGDPAALADAIEYSVRTGSGAHTKAARVRFDALFTPGPVACRLLCLYSDAIRASRWSRKDEDGDVDASVPT